MAASRFLCLIALVALPLAPLAANATVTEYTRAADSWLGVSDAEGHSFDQFYPGIASGLGCLSSPDSVVTLVLDGGIVTLWAFDGATPKCAITDASTGPRVSDGNLLTSGTRLVMAFDPPIFGFYGFFASLPLGQTATMSLYAGGALEASLTVPGVHATDAVGHGFTSTVAIDSIAFTSTDVSIVLGAFVNLASGEPSLGADLIPAYGSSVQRDFACVFTPVTVSIGDAQALEGNAGTTALAFPVTVSGPMALPVTVHYATANGSATLADNDYSSASDTLTIAPPAPEFLLKWGMSGFTGLAVDGSGNVYATDVSVRKFTSSGVFITAWGSAGSGDGQFSNPNGIAVDDTGNVYVADTGNNRIQKFTSSGVFVTKWGSTGSGDGQFSVPRDVAVDASGQVYVVDDVNRRIQKFTGDGTFVTKWGSHGTGDGQFLNPSAIAVDGSGNVYVTDRGVQSVQKFTSNGAFVTKWGSSGTGDGQFDGLWGVAVDAAGFVYCSDQDNARIQKFTADGDFVVKWGSPGSADGQFGPFLFGVDVDDTGHVYVADRSNGRIQKFQPVAPTGTIIVDVTGDLDYESDETLHVDLSSPVNASIAVAQGTGTIQNDDATTAVADLPVTEFAIARVAPNPSAGRVTIEYTVAHETQVRLSVYDLQGRRVAVLADQVRPVGRYRAVWAGQTKGGRAEAGIYFVSYRAAGRTMTSKLVLAR